VRAARRWAPPGWRAPRPTARPPPSPTCSASPRSCCRPGRVIHPDTLRAATTAAFPDLAGVLPGFGAMSPNPWGLGRRAARLEAPPLDAPGGVAAHVRPLRSRRHDALGRPRRRRGLRRAHGPGVRALGGQRLAGAGIRAAAGRRRIGSARAFSWARRRQLHMTSPRPQRGSPLAELRARNAMRWAGLDAEQPLEPATSATNQVWLTPGPRGPGLERADRPPGQGGRGGPAPAGGGALPPGGRPRVRLRRRLAHLHQGPGHAAGPPLARPRPTHPAGGRGRPGGRPASPAPGPGARAPPTAGAGPAPARAHAHAAGSRCGRVSSGRRACPMWTGACSSTSPTCWRVGRRPSPRSRPPPSSTATSPSRTCCTTATGSAPCSTWSGPDRRPSTSTSTSCCGPARSPSCTWRPSTPTGRRPRTTAGPGLAGRGPP
jgi:hypothetical protein